MKIIAKIIILVAVLLIGVYLGQYHLSLPGLVNNQPEIEKGDMEEASVSLMLDFGNGEIMVFTGVLGKEKNNVFDFLEKITSENNLELGYKDYGGGLGVMVESINGITNNVEPGHFWQYWVDNSYAQIGASNYQLKNGDIIEWKYTKGQFNN